MSNSMRINCAIASPRWAARRQWTLPKRTLFPPRLLREILAVNLKEEAKAINHYQSIFKMIDRDDVFATK